MPDPSYQLARLADLPPIDCPCGTTRRGFTEPASPTSVHLLDLSTDAAVHYHKQLTETYIILEGEGDMELDGERVPVKPLDAIRINPGCRHRAVGRMKILVVVTPPFDPADEWFD